jgi:hypothetical protein
MPKTTRHLLDELCSFGPRFHGSHGAARATSFLAAQLEDAGASVLRQEVTLPGWTPGEQHQVTLLTPEPRPVRSWPMLWSGPTEGTVRGRVVEQGPQGLWGDSMVWRKFAVVDDLGSALAYLHARDGGPAAPQPLPAASDRTVAHLSIGRIDGLQLSEWLSDGRPVEVEVTCHAGPAPAASGHNLVIDVPGTGSGHVLVTAHTDTFYNTVGAYDNGSGTIALLLLAQHWLARPPGPTVRLAFCAAEEWHLAGSRHLVSALSPEQVDAIDYVVNLDGLGRGDFVELFGGPESFEAAVLTVLREYAARQRPGLRIASRFPPTKGTDDAAFYAAGLPTAFLTFNDLHRLHQPEDLPNDGIAGNIDFTVPLVAHVVETLSRPADRPPRLDVL